MVSRDFVEADYPEVAALWRASGSNVMDRAELAMTLRREGNAMLVEHSARGSVVGVVLGTFDGRRGWIHRLAVDPSLRRTGVARRLVADVEGRLRAAGVPRINLLVVSTDPGTTAFWQSLGYGSRPDVLFSKPT